MGKGTDKLYITHSEWASEDAFGASTGAGVGKQNVDGASFKRLPFNYCALSLQPFKHPVCTATGTIFDLTHIVPWLKKHGTNPIDGQPLKSADLVKLNFTKNDDGEYVDPATLKVFTDNTHIVALRNTGNVFAWDTVERLNIKAKNWQDLVTDEAFTRKDIITLQDPQNIESRDMSAFKYLKDGTSTLTPEQEAERADASANINSATLGSAAKIIKAKEAVARSRAEREKAVNAREEQASKNGKPGQALAAQGYMQKKPVPYNAARYTSGKAAASFTSTGLTPDTSNELALLSDEEYMLKPRRVNQVGYARLQTNHGDINIELYPEHAPKAVWNFIRLAKKGYYRQQIFHRNIRNFMIQGGDPTGTGKGGQSIWGRDFEDELEGPRRHDKRGVLSMANKGKATNSSQFFITYRPAKHLDLKHTVFGQVVGGMEALASMEAVAVDEKTHRPRDPIELRDLVVFVDPFEEFQKQRRETEEREAREEETRRRGGTEDDRTTWTGKRIRTAGAAAEEPGRAVGKYLRVAMAEPGDGNGRVMVEEEQEEAFQVPAKKKRKGGFGNFDGW